MADIYREVEEDLRRDRAAQLWKKYRYFVYAILAVLILGAVANHGWRFYDIKQRSAQSEDFGLALELVRDGETATALEALSELADGGSGYGLLAAFERAKLLAGSGDPGAAVEVWSEIARSADTPPAFRDLATLLSVMHQLEDGDSAALRDQLDPLTAGGQPFRPTALELQAVIALKDGDRAAARNLFGQIVSEPGAPSGQRTRAAQMLAALQDVEAE